VPLPEGLQDFESAAARKHHIQHDQIERFGVRAEEPIFARGRHHHVVVLRLKRRRENLGQLGFVFDDEDPH
jgi:hypothetical protein